LTAQYVLNNKYREPKTIVASRKAAKSYTSKLAGGQVEESQSRTLSHHESSIKCQPTIDRPENTVFMVTPEITNDRTNKKTKGRTLKLKLNPKERVFGL
jgi:hypothetical protein